MMLSQITVKNWQNIKSGKIICEPMMTLIGTVNAGQSSMIAALTTFLGLRIANIRDFGDQSSPIEIEGTFVDLPKALLQRHMDIVCDNTITIRVEFNRQRKRQIQARMRGGKWYEIDATTYRDVVGTLNVVYVPPILTPLDGTELLSRMLHIIDIQACCDSDILQIITSRYDAMSRENASMEYRRKILFDIIHELYIRSKARKSSILTDTILIFEEPEAYMSPLFAKELYLTFHHLAKLGTQIFVTTHSGAFVSLKHYKSIAIFRQIDNVSEIHQYRKNLFSKNDIDEFNMNYYINPDRSEMFFASKVILVEGQTDKIVIQALGEDLGVYMADYAIIETGSKGLIPTFLRLLNCYQIPYVVVFDLDQHSWRSKTERTNSNARNQAIRNMVNPKFGSVVEMDNDIEEEIYNKRHGRKNYKNKPFYALQAVKEKGYIIPPKLRAKIIEIYK